MSWPARAVRLPRSPRSHHRLDRTEGGLPSRSPSTPQADRQHREYAAVEYASQPIGMAVPAIHCSGCGVMAGRSAEWMIRSGMIRRQSLESDATFFAGTVAALLWRRHPELVAGMVLCATAPDFTVTPFDHLLLATAGTWYRHVGGPLRPAAQIAIGLASRAGGWPNGGLPQAALSRRGLLAARSHVV
jgi:hypothetical protein